MTEKQLFGIVKGHREHITDHTGRLYSDSEVANLLNELHDENKQLKQAISDWKSSYDELYENCGKLEKKNEQLKSEIVHLENKLAYKDQHNNNDFKGIEDWASGGF